ncbi:MAG: 5-nucleotidase [Pseudonocardia sp.]|uniref:5'/3'-nucleotidase SurE n=1 Tax=Pseudonocardia sp. TaxID=60912 RepID=UPI002623E31E|nr:5'/3'-nucleotidase SurE [Pseudonocardia sp.]MCU1628509.1 5-nucleotidase [Pseudonocardia sp.]
MARALITNDDGIDSAGLAALAAAARDAGLDVVVAAPDRQYSGAGASSAATLQDGRTVVTAAETEGLPDVPAYAVQAAPAHIVVAALAGWLDPVPDVVLSGINRGGNAGRAVLHSGTVGAALTAGLHERRALAVSLDVPLGAEEPPRWEAVAGLVPGVLDVLWDSPEGTVLSLNSPDVPPAAVKELRIATLDRSGTVRTLVEDARSDGLKVVELETDDEPEPGSDRALLAAGHATITALQGLREAPEALDPERPRL